MVTVNPGGVAVVDSPATSIEGVIERMAAIDAVLPSADGVAYFNRLYLKVTEAVLERARDATFENAEFLVRLDVLFANLFFEAYSNWTTTGTCANAWRPLFEARARAESAPIQFALAGMNAHINHDLPLAVLATCRQLGLEPTEETPHHRDYNRANEILRATEEQIKSWFASGLIATIDVACGKLDDALAMFSIYAARSLAWEHAQMLWRLQDDPVMLALFERGLARMVGFAGRGILL
jgi:hypothetical protein